MVVVGLSCGATNFKLHYTWITYLSFRYKPTFPLFNETEKVTERNRAITKKKQKKRKKGKTKQNRNTKPIENRILRKKPDVLKFLERIRRVVRCLGELFLGIEVTHIARHITRRVTRIVQDVANVTRTGKATEEGSRNKKTK